MLLHAVTSVSLDAFRAKSGGKKIVLLYPWANYRNFFLRQFLRNATQGFLYYRISDEHTSLKHWLGGLVEEFQSVLGDFGKNLNQALIEAKLAAIGEALAADLKAYSSEPMILFIDEFDRVLMDADFNQFIHTLVDALPKNVQIVFSSRLLKYQLWQEMVARGYAVILGTDQHKDYMMFTVEPMHKPQLEVYSFGTGQVFVNGKLITDWDGALPRNLFFYFMDHPLVTRDEIFEAFWPKLSVKDATNVFHVTKRKITERISSKVTMSDNYELTQFNSGFYMPSDKVVRHYDVASFQEAVDEASTVELEKEEMALLSRAIDTYKAPFLQTVDMSWVSDRRNILRQMYAQALIGMGRIYQQNNEDQRAAGFFTKALQEVPEREDIYRQLMKLYQNMGLPDNAVMAYRILEQHLDETLRIPPSRETREVYEEMEIRRHE